jgi:anthranilate synthase component II
MKILILDNYDSFTYNLVHIVRKLGYKNLDVIRNDKITVDEVSIYDKIILSPGPGIPVEAGILMDLIKTYGSKKPILGVCLGHQALGESFGAELYNIQQVIHGKALDTKVVVDDYIFEGLPNTFKSGRYHSWAVKNLPEDLEITAVDDRGIVQALRHKKYDIRGVQFHPESVMTEFGEKLLLNWLKH